MAEDVTWSWDASPPIDDRLNALKTKGESIMENAPVVEVETPTPAAEGKPEAPKKSPAEDLRNIQMLLVSGIYPGNIAPQVVAAYSLLDKMALKVEADAGYKA